MLMILPAFARDHAFGDRLADIEHAVDIDSHQLVPGFGRKLFQRHATLNAGVVHQDVDRCLRLNRTNRVLDGVGLSHIEHLTSRLMALGDQCRDCAIQLDRIAAIEHYCRAGGCQSVREAEADSLT